LGQLEFYRKASLRDRANLLCWRQAASGFLVGSLVTSLLVAAVSIFRDPYPAALLGTVVALLLIVLVVGLRHVYLKYRDMRRELKEDNEELQQADSLSSLAPLQPKDRPDFGKLTWRFLIAGLGVGMVLLPGILLGCWWAVNRLLAWVPELEAFAKTDAEHRTDIHDWMVISMVLTVAVAALFQWYTEKMAFAGQHNQYKRMRSVFGRAHAHVEAQLKAGNVVKAQETLLQLGQEALAEHADWLLLHRDRPMELPRLEI
jgi:hypothetical protein